MVRVSERLTEALKIICKPTIVRKTFHKQVIIYVNLNTLHCFPPFWSWTIPGRFNCVILFEESLKCKAKLVLKKYWFDEKMLVYFRQIWLVSKYTSFQHNHYSGDNHF